MQILFDPFVIIALSMIAVVAIMCAAWVLTVHIQAHAHAQAERDYRIERARQQIVEAARYQVLVAQSRAIAEAPRAR